MIVLYKCPCLFKWKPVCSTPWSWGRGDDGAVSRPGFGCAAARNARASDTNKGWGGNDVVRGRA